MPRASLVIQRYSDVYVHNFARFVHDALRKSIDSEAPLFLPDEIDDADYPEGLVFLIGEKFRPFARRPGCRYVYLNLSVVSALGNLFMTSLDGHRVIRRKRRLLAEKLPLIDVLLDYYPPQTEVLSRRLDLPVLGFKVALTPRAPLPAEARMHDICFVGGVNDRRREVLDRLASQGARLSPSEGAPIEEIAAVSRLCLNIHAERSRHLETPRIAAALSVGTPVLTETSHAPGSLAGHAFIVERSRAGLAEAALELLADPERLSALGQEAAAWYREVYFPGAERAWRDLCQRLCDTTRGYGDAAAGLQTLREAPAAPRHAVGRHPT